RAFKLLENPKTTLDILLGNNNMYNGSNTGNGYNSGVFARVGLTGETKGIDESGSAKRVPRYASSGVMNTATEGAATSGKWFRFEILADLDAGTYDYTIYNVCPSSESPAFGAAATGVLFQKTGIQAYFSSTELTSIAFSCYYGKVYFDNACVWHKPTGASAETLVYSNNFTTRKLYAYDAQEDSLVGTLSKDPVGIDGWTRLYTAIDPFFLVGGENPALGFESVGGYSTYAVHDIGGVWTSGRLTTRFDMRAPSAWSQSLNNSGTWIWLGGDLFREGNLHGGSSSADRFSKYAACGAGLSSGYSSAASSTFAVYRGDCAGGGTWDYSGTATSGNWYRFVVKTNLATGKSEVTVYDMGTAAPGLDTSIPTGENAVVATFTDIPFRQTKRSLGGVSCIGIQAKEVKAASPLSATDYRVLVDNFRISHQPFGTVVVFR
ncbi:MAG: hypothetical protein IJC66_01330, partial [Kiritimatiellae bacterium]|nr:hypothetical protein [Kiritimatiellia bacterium]